MDNLHRTRVNAGAILAGLPPHLRAIVQVQLAAQCKEALFQMNSEGCPREQWLRQDACVATGKDLPAAGGPAGLSAEHKPRQPRLPSEPHQLHTAIGGCSFHMLHCKFGLLQ